MAAEARGRFLEGVLVALSNGSIPPVSGQGGAALARMLDISNLKFQERDQLVEAFIKYRQKV